MGRYELVRSDDAPAVAADLEAGTAAPCDGYPKRRVFTPSPSPSPAPASTRYRQRLVSLDVFRGITVLVRQNHSHPPSARSLAPLLFH
jgi:heparan-alpha-glucosaminide N-acetyltransferase